MTSCDIATVTVEVGAQQVGLSVPAYTRDPIEFEEAMRETLSTYLTKTERDGSKPSTADYAFYLLALASREPTEIPE